MRLKSTLKKLKAALCPIAWPMVGLGTLGALLTVASFPPYSAWALSFIAVVPLVLAVLLARSAREVFWAGLAHSVLTILFGFGWISFVATNFGGLPWIVGKLVLAAFSLIGEPCFFAFALLMYLLLPLLARIKSAAARAAVFFLGLSAVYIGLDFLYPKIFPSTFGQVLYGWFSVAQLAEFVGVYGLTLPVTLVNFGLAVLIAQKLKIQSEASTRVLKGLSKWAFVSLALAGIMLGAGHVWGKKRIAELTQLEKNYTKRFRFSVIQANIGDVEKLASERGFEPAIYNVLSSYRSLSMQSIGEFKPDLLIWPETAYPFLYTHLKDAHANRSGAARDEWIKGFVKELGTDFFFGSYSLLNDRDFNTAFLVTHNFELKGQYRKSILLAFGEYIPLGPLSPLIQDIIPAIANFGRGPGPEVYATSKGVKLGPQICYEGIFPDHSRGSVALGADVLMNITNDSWFGEGAEPWLHLLLTVFRSIEVRRPMIRATNTGVSTVVGMTGDMRYRTRLFEPARIDAELRLPGVGQSAPETFFYRHGDLFGKASAAIALLVMWWVAWEYWGGRVLGRTRKKRPTSKNS